VPPASIRRRVKVGDSIADRSRSEPIDRFRSAFGSSLTAAFAILLLAPLAYGQTEPAIEDFFAAASLDTERAASAQERIAAQWRDGYAAMIVDMLDQLRQTGFVDPRGFVRLARLTQFLEQQTGQSFGGDVEGWRRWLWSQPYAPHPDYGEFKGLLYADLDPRFRAFFRPPVDASIRLDEIQWGGVAVNGIPPLDHPSVVTVDRAGYLDDDNVVFGIVVDGEARAYPKRILAWHELALDDVGGKDLAVVYCTLCGTVIPFDATAGGKVRKFGTSGLLYRSNKLMFDDATKSLWSSLTGRPVVGPLVGSGLELRALPVVTTRWGEWRKLHPDTTVLSLDTGFARDYSEGAAYRAYFGTDALMFDVALRDGRLPNKAEVLVLRSLPTGDADARPPPLAIAADYLAERPVFHLTVADVPLVVLTSEGGANRVYAAQSFEFETLDGDGQVLDSEGRSWRIEESHLQAGFDADLRLPRVAAHRAFWFGWYAQHPDTVLID
jgi:hypothetical protein